MVLSIRCPPVPSFGVSFLRRSLQTLETGNVYEANETSDTQNSLKLERVFQYMMYLEAAEKGDHSVYKSKHGEVSSIKGKKHGKLHVLDCFCNVRTPDLRARTVVCFCNKCLQMLDQGAATCIRFLRGYYYFFYGLLPPP